MHLNMSIGSTKLPERLMDLEKVLVDFREELCGLEEALRTTHVHLPLLPPSSSSFSSPSSSLYPNPS